MVIKLGNIYGFTGGSFAGIVYSAKGIAPALNSMQGGNRQPLIVVKSKKQIPIDGTINKPRGGAAENIQRNLPFYSRKTVQRTTLDIRGSR